MATRCTILPVSINAGALASTMNAFPTSGTGIDAAGTGTGFATTFASGPYSGVQFTNNGFMFLVVLNATASVNAYHLIGQKAGNQVQPYTTYTTSVPNASGVPGWLGPWSVQQFQQQDASQFNGGNGGTSPGGVIGQTAVTGDMVCIDFNTTTTLAVRLYQLVPALP